MPRQPVGTMYFLGSRRAKPRSLSACPLTLSFSPSPPCFPAAISKSICLPFPRTVPLSIPFNLACKCRLYIFRRTGRGQPTFPGPGPIFVSASEPKGLPPPLLLLCVSRRTKEKEGKRSTRIYLARKPPSMLWTNGGNSKKVSNSPRDRVSRSTRKRLPTFLTMDLSFVPIARFASALNGKLVGNRSISQIARPLFLVERSIVNSFRARYIDSSKNQRCSGRDNSFLIFQMFGVFVGNFGFLPDYKITNSIVPNSAILVSNIYIYFKSKTKDERKI